jgi:hypothetical protein
MEETMPELGSTLSSLPSSKEIFVFWISLMIRLASRSHYTFVDNIATQIAGSQHGQSP